MKTAASPAGTVVVAVKPAVVAPSRTVTLGGTLASGGELELSVTSAPPAGAGVESVTVPALGFPPTTAFGFIVTLLANGGGVAQTSGVPVPPQIWGAIQVPQASQPPQPSGIAPQVFPCAAQVVGVQPPAHTFGVPPPPHVLGALQAPQPSVVPQPSGIVPQFFPSDAQVTRAQVGDGTTAR